MASKLMTIDGFAFQLGVQAGKTREASLPFHIAYTEATPEQRTDLRTRWMRNHIMGNLKVSDKAADRILSQTRDERSEVGYKAYKKASADFSYHVVRPDAKPVETKSHTRLSREVREAAKAYLNLFDNSADAIKALRAVAK